MVKYVAVLLAVYFQQVIWQPVSLTEINLERCRPPDYPLSGYYGPVKPFYFPGDVIHYFCDPGTYIGGNYRRVCVDNGDWSGDTPVCDSKVVFSRVEQSSTYEGSESSSVGCGDNVEDCDTSNAATAATDGCQCTCSKTQGEEKGATWTGYLQDFAREVLRVMLFLPKGPVAYEVFIVKSDGSEVSCGKGERIVDIYDWAFHNCLEPHNTGAVAVKVKSLNGNPLEICELWTHTLTDPTCADPHHRVENGRLILNRKNATLKCNEGYVEYDGGPTKLDCMRTGVWSRRPLFCDKKKFISEEPNPESEGDRVGVIDP